MGDSVISRNGFYISAIDANGGQLMYSFSENIEVIINDKPDKVIKKLFELLLFKF